MEVYSERERTRYLSVACVESESDTLELPLQRIIRAIRAVAQSR
jgi:hypothetical protein